MNTRIAQQVINEAIKFIDYEGKSEFTDYKDYVIIEHGDPEKVRKEIYYNKDVADVEYNRKSDILTIWFMEEEATTEQAA